MSEVKRYSKAEIEGVAYAGKVRDGYVLASVYDVLLAENKLLLAVKDAATGHVCKNGALKRALDAWENRND